MPADAPAHVIGVDPDRDSVTASVVEASTTAEVAAAAFTASRGGYVQLLEWADRHTSTEQRTWAIEGAGGYGAGLAGHLNDAGERVVEFGHPRSAATRDGAKTDALGDARRAAREVLGQREPCIPRARGRREALRVLDTTRRGAQRARVAAICELKALLVTAPVDLRDQLRGLTTAALVAKCSALRPPQSPDEELAATKQALRSIARRIKTLTEETDQLEAAIRPLISAAAPQLLDQPGVGPITAAQIYIAWSHHGRCRNEAAFARLGGVAPLDAPASRPPPGRQHATASTAAATATSTGHCTPSPSPAADTAPTPRPTSPKESARAKPHEKPGAASNATSPASSTDSYSTHQTPLDKHRSIGLLRRWLPKGTDLNIGPVAPPIIEDRHALSSTTSPSGRYTARLGVCRSDR